MLFIPFVPIICSQHCIIYHGYWDPSAVRGSGELEVIVEGEREGTGAVVFVSEGEGINVADDVINKVEK